MADKTIHVIISGRVQGVFYRDWTVSHAQTLGLDGWVRNLHDGSVEAVFSGEDAAVDEMVNRCYTGSPNANVSDIQQHLVDKKPNSGFIRKPSM